MYFLSETTIQNAICEYQNLGITKPEVGDGFFERYGPGNLVDQIDKPYERFSDYEELLRRLQKVDPVRYKLLHKGTPFYFLAWTAFDLRNFEKGLFYIDAGISEDIRNFPNIWLDKPGAAFLTLRQPQIQVARRTIDGIRHLLKEQTDRFNKVSGKPPIDIKALVGSFVIKLLLDQAKRTIISAFYVFLLEFQDRYTELFLRSTQGGSIQPFIIHLFKGGLIFESLLKHFYPLREKENKPTKTLSDIFKTSAFRKDFVDKVETSSESLRDIVAGIKDDSISCAFTTIAKLRNTAGHNLVWEDIFDNPDNYKKLFEQEINAILYIILVKFL